MLVRYLGALLYITAYIITLTADITDTIIIIFKYFGIVTETTIMFLYYASMLFTVIDKFLEIFLNLKYPLYFNVNKATYIISATWLIGIVLCVTVIVSEHLFGYINHLHRKYFFVSFDILFIIISISCYSYIFVKYTQSRTNPHQIGYSESTENSQIIQTQSTSSSAVKNIFNIFRKSRFYISVLLILNFLLLTVIPDLFVFFIIENINHHIHRNIMTVIINILYEISLLVDAWIYIYINKQVRRILWRKLHYIGWLRKNISSSEQSDEANVFTENNGRSATDTSSVTNISTTST